MPQPPTSPSPEIIMPSVSDILDTMDYGTAPESNAHAVAWLKEHEAGFGHFISGANHQHRGVTDERVHSVRVAGISGPAVHPVPSDNGPQLVRGGHGRRVQRKVVRPHERQAAAQRREGRCRQRKSRGESGSGQAGGRR